MNWIDRFWSKVDQSGSCWEWKSYRHLGYGRFYIRGKSEAAHRIAYELSSGLPMTKWANLTVDHICRNRGCVNPKHLRLVTRGENVLAGIGASATNQRKTRCPQNHPYDGKKKNGNRFCRSCRSEKQRISWERRKNEANKRRRKQYAIAQAEGK